MSALLVALSLACVPKDAPGAGATEDSAEGAFAAENSSALDFSTTPRNLLMISIDTNCAFKRTMN